MSEFSLDSLSSLLDDELALEAEAPQAPPQIAPSPSQVPAATIPALQASEPAPTELVSTPAAPLSALTQPNPNVRKSWLEETQLYKSTPQPTIDLSVVRRSASEPTLAFTGVLSECLNGSATVPAVVDPKKSSVPETSLWAADEATNLSAVTQPVPPPLAPVAATSDVSAEASDPTADAVESPLIANADPDPEFDPPGQVAPQLAAFFEGQPRRTTDVRWDEAVESDRQFTTMLLSDMDELPWKAAVANPTPDPVPVVSAVVEESLETVDATSAVSPAMPVSTPALDSSAFDVLEVAGAEQASFASTLAPQRLPEMQDAAVESNSNAQRNFPEPTQEIRQLASFLLERSTPGVSTVIALVGCEATRIGAETSLALAAAAADATGVSTIIVDGDFAHREISAACNIAAASGFAEALGQPAKGRSFAQAIGRENLSLLPAGQALPGASEAAACISAWIAKAKQEYGLILVWLGSGEGEIARRLCGAADAALLLAAVDRDRPSRIEAAAERLRSSNARTLGVALVG